jgi:hypothetical protein
MIRKFLFSAPLVGLLISGVSLSATPVPQQEQQKRQADQSKSAAGKVSDIGSDKRSFSLAVVDASGKPRAMQFVVDGNTQVQGTVTVGTDVTVQYQPSTDGKNLAITIAPKNSQ